MTTTAEPPISVREFAERTGISVRLAYELIDSGEVSALLLPSRQGTAGKRRHFKVEADEVGKFLGRARKAARAS